MGLAWFDGAGTLVGYRSVHLANRATMKRAVPTILRDLPPLGFLVLEGDEALARIWRRAAARLPEPVDVLEVSAETWRPTFFHPRERRSGSAAKAHALQRAREIIHASPAPNPTSLTDDAAEAVLIGVWAVAELGLTAP